VSAGRARAGGDCADGDRAGRDRAGGDRAGGDCAGGDRAGGDRAGRDSGSGDWAGLAGGGLAGGGRDWAAWHEAYDDPGSPLAQRLLAVQAWIAAALDQAPPGPLRAVSICAGQGRDLIGVLREHPRRGDVTARLVELDPRNAAAARQLAADAGLTQVEVITGDAAQTDAYAGLVPANLMLACGVFGNITDQDVARTIRCCAGLCATGGTVVWTRGRRKPDLIPQICEWFAAEGFELLGVSEPETKWGVGAHRFAGTSAPLPAGERMFTFVGAEVLRRKRGNS
jgi:Putative methyltransferase